MTPSKKLLLVVPLLLILLGCQCWPAGQIVQEVSEVSQDIAAEISEEVLKEIEKTFPLPDSAAIINHVGNTLNFKTRLTVEEVVSFYRDAYGEMGLTERASETNITETNANLTLENCESEKAVKIQAADQGSGMTKVTIHLEDD